MSPMVHEGTSLGVIMEQGEWPLRPKGARSMAQNKERSREQGKCNLAAGSTKIWKGEQGAAKFGKKSKEQEKLSGSKRKN